MRQRTHLQFLVVLVLFALAGGLARLGRAPAPRVSRSQSQAAAQLARLPISFEPNRGQADSRVRFLSRGAHSTLFLTGSETVLRLPHAAVRLRLRGGNPSPDISGAEKLPGRVNYLIGNDPDRWQHNIPVYAQVRYREVYPGIDALYYGSGGKLEYDFVVRPGADPNAIQLRLEGAQRVEVDPAGDLVLHTSDGPVRQHRPRAYQERAGIRTEVAASYVLKGGGGLPGAEVTFRLGAYDTQRELVIDPVLTYSTCFGGTGGTVVPGDGNVVVDGSGNAYVAGTTRALDFPVTPNAPFTTFTGGLNDEAFVAKIATDAAGAASLVFATYLGGSGWESSPIWDNIGLALGPDKSVYVAGNTYCDDFPTTPGAFDRTFNSPSTFSPDGYVSRLDPTGSSLLYSTYLGGNGVEQVTDIAVDASGSAYVTGWQNGSNFPHTPGAYDPRPADQTWRAAFIAKLNPLGTGLTYSLRFGGWQGDNWPYAIAVDASGCAYVTGYTNTRSFATTPGAFVGSEDFVGDNTFVCKFSADGASLLLSTFLDSNGSGTFLPHGIALGPTGNIYVAGETGDRNYPVTPGGVQTKAVIEPDGGFLGSYLTVLDPTGSSLVYSTLLCGDRPVVVYAMAVDADGIAYLTGDTNSDQLPLKDPVKPSFVGDMDGVDAFVTVIDPSRFGADSLVYSTLLGGTWGDWGTGIAVDANKNAYVVGIVYSPDFPIVNGIRSGSGSGGPYLFLSRLAPGPRPGVPSNLSASAVSSSQIDLTWTDTTDTESGFQIERATGSGAFALVTTTSANITLYHDSGLAPNTAYRYRVRATGPGGNSDYSNIAVRATLPAAPAAASNLTAELAGPAAVTLHWQDHSADETGFRLERTTDNFAHVVTAIASANVTAYSDTGLTANTAYTYRVVAFARNDDGVTAEASPSNTAAALTLPAAPTALAVTASSSGTPRLGRTQLDLAWQSPGGPPINAEVERSTDGGATFAPLATVYAPAHAYSDTGLAEDTAYSYRVRAVNASGAGPYSAPASGHTLPAPPPAPLALQVTVAGNGELDLTWTDGGGSLVGVRVERQAAGEPGYTLRALLSAGSTSYFDTGLAPATTYHYRVTAFNTGGDSASAEVSASTDPLPPAAPGGLAVARPAPPLALTQVTVSWTDASTNEDSFLLEQSTDAGAHWSALPTVATPNAPGTGETVSVTVAPLTPGVSYSFRVSAVDDGRQSAWAGPANAPPVFSISGTIRVGAAPVAGVTVSASGVSALTSTDGTYTLPGFPTGSYTVTPSMPEATFSPENRLVVVGPDRTGIDFAAAVKTYTVRGIITRGGLGRAGVVLTAGGLTAITAQDGTYSLSGLPAGTYTLTPSQAETTFTPANRPVTVGPSQLGLDFTATVNTYSVSGTVATDAGPLAGVTLTAGAASAVTSANGTYTLTGLVAGQYQVQPALAGYQFTPGTRTVSLGPSQTGVNFSAAPLFNVSGTITVGGAALPGVVVTAGGMQAVTAGDGTYHLSGLLAGTYTATPMLSGYRFAPAFRAVTVGPDQTGVDFTAIPQFTISGSISTGSGPLAGVNLSVGSATATTGGNGDYTLAGLDPGTYVVTPTLAGYAFTPASQTIVVGPIRSGVSFTAARVYSLRGTVRDNGVGLAGAILRVNGSSQTTGADGTYLFPGLTAGGYTITISQPGYRFEPPSRTVSVGPDQAALDFAAIPVFQIRGRVTVDGSGLPGAVVTAGAAATLTGADGTYTLTSLDAGPYTVIATKDRFRFEPASRAVIVGPDQLGIDFAGTALYSILGRVTTAGVGVGGVTVAAGSFTTVTGSDGSYLLSGLPAGQYTVVPRKAGSGFSPASTPVTIGPDASGISFQAYATYEIRGRVTILGVPISGVAVQAGSRLATSGADGFYQIADLPAGEYTVVPRQLGIGFSPATRKVTLAPSQSAASFDGTTVKLTAWKISPTAVRSRKTATLRVTVFPAPSMPLAVALSSSLASAAPVPATLTLPAGAATATATIHAGVVRKLTKVKLSAQYNGSTLSATLAVKP